MTRDEGIDRLTEDMIDTMELEDMIEFVYEGLQWSMSKEKDEDLAEEWEARFPNTDNPFKGEMAESG